MQFVFGKLHYLKSSTTQFRDGSIPLSIIYLLDIMPLHGAHTDGWSRRFPAGAGRARPMGCGWDGVGVGVEEYIRSQILPSPIADGTITSKVTRK